MVLERVGPPPSISLTSFLLPPPPPPARSTHPTDQPTHSLRSALFSGSFHGCHGRPPARGGGRAGNGGHRTAASSSSLPVAIIPVRLVLAPLPLPPSSLFSLLPSTLILSQPKLSGGEKRRSWQEGMYAPSSPPLPSLCLPA